MFFKKNIIPENTEDSQINHAKSDPIQGDNIINIADTRPIYIVGSGGLNCFLAGCFMEAGERVIIVDSPKNTDILTNSIYIKEDYLLSRQKYKFEASFWMKEEPKLVIIAAKSNHIKSLIVALSPQKIKNAPIINLSVLADDSYLRGYLGDSIIQAYCHGYITSDAHQISILGQAPRIELTGTIDPDNFKIVSHLFNQAQITYSINLNEKQSFWEFFAPYAIASLSACAYNQNFSILIKNKEKRENIKACLQELLALLNCSGLSLNQDTLLEQLFNTPSGFVFPLQQDIKQGRPGELDTFYNILLNESHQHKCKLPLLNTMIKNIYNIILA